MRRRYDVSCAFFVYDNDRVGLEILRKMSLFLPPKMLFVRVFFIKCDFL